MKASLFVIVVAFISCATAISDENYRSWSEESASLSSEENESQSAEKSSSGCKISYTLWIGDNVDEIHSINLQSVCGTVFLEAMRLAAEKKEQFAFEHASHPRFGSFVTQISGLINDAEAKTYWTLYDLTAEPDVYNAPGDDNLSSVGVSSLKVSAGHSYLFWYRTVDDDEDYN